MLASTAQASGARNRREAFQWVVPPWVCSTTVSVADVGLYVEPRRFRGYPTKTLGPIKPGKHPDALPLRIGEHVDCTAILSRYVQQVFLAVTRSHPRLATIGVRCDRASLRHRARCADRRLLSAAPCQQHRCADAQ